MLFLLSHLIHNISTKILERDVALKFVITKFNALFFQKDIDWTPKVDFLAAPKHVPTCSSSSINVMIMYSKNYQFIIPAVKRQLKNSKKTIFFLSIEKLKNCNEFLFKYEK